MTKCMTARKRKNIVIQQRPNIVKPATAEPSNSNISLVLWSQPILFNRRLVRCFNYVTPLWSAVDFYQHHSVRRKAWNTPCLVTDWNQKFDQKQPFSSSSLSSSHSRSNLSCDILLLLSHDRKMFLLPLRYCTLARYRSSASSMRLMSTIGFSTNSFHNRECYGAHIPNMLFLLFSESSDLRGSSMLIWVAVWVCRCYEAHVLNRLFH